MISHDLTSPRDARCGHYCSTGWGWVAAHAVACVRDGDRGRTSLQFARCGGPLVEFYGEGKGGSNPDFPSYSEGEVVEDEVSRGPAQWSVLGLGATRPQKFEGQGAHRGVSFVHPMPPCTDLCVSMCGFYMRCSASHLPLMRVTCVTCVTCFNMRVTCAVHLLRRVGLAAAPRARLGLFRLFTFDFHFGAFCAPSDAV